MRPGDFDKTRRWPPIIVPVPERKDRRLAFVGIAVVIAGIAALIVWLAFGWI